jgi:hypothetical protein
MRGRRGEREKGRLKKKRRVGEWEKGRKRKFCDFSRIY